MLWSFLTSPLGLLAAGAALLFVVFLAGRLGRGTKCEGTSHKEIRDLAHQLETERREVTRLLTEARQTTRHLEQMIHNFEETFYASPAADKPSVSAIFEGLSDSVRAECRVMAKRTDDLRCRNASYARHTVRPIK